MVGCIQGYEEERAPVTPVSVGPEGTVQYITRDNPNSTRILRSSVRRESRYFPQQTTFHQAMGRKSCRNGWIDS
jgi:hypothetical protein